MPSLNPTESQQLPGTIAELQIIDTELKELIIEIGELLDSPEEVSEKEAKNIFEECQDIQKSAKEFLGEITEIWEQQFILTLRDFSLFSQLYELVHAIQASLQTLSEIQLR